MSDPFPYSRDHRVAVCRACQSCIIPTATGQVRHLCAAPHWLSGHVLKATAALLSSYDLATEEELRRDRPAQGPPCAPIDGLETYTGYACTYDGCGYHTRRLAKMHEHMPAHGTTARQQKRRQRQGSGPLWRECLLQTYFTAKGRIDYFAVKEEGEEDGNKDANNEDEARIEDEGRGGSREAEQEEDRKEALFRTLIRDLGKADDDLTEQAGVVQDFDGSRSARVAWLGRTGFPAHLRGLRDEEIRSSYPLPPKRVLDGLVATGGGSTGDDDEGREEEDPDLVRILVAAESMLRDAYDLCSETSPDRKMTQQRANILNEFYAGASGRSAGFRYFKNESTLVEYFRRAKELLTYFYRVVYCEDGHFTRERADQIVPRDVIEPNSAQQRAMRDISKALRRGRKETGEGEEEEEEVRATPRGKGGAASKEPKRPRHPTCEVFLRATPRGKGGVSLEERKGHRHLKGNVALPGLPQRKGGVSSEAWLLQRWMTNTLDTEVIGAPDDG